MIKIGMKRIKLLNPFKRKTSMYKSKANPLDKLYSEYIRLMAHDTCQRCYKPVGFKRLQCCHYFGRSNQRVRYDEANGVALCAGCHHYFHGHPLEFTYWTIARLGEEQFDELTARANINNYKLDKKAIEIYLKEKIKFVKSRISRI